MLYVFHVDTGRMIKFDMNVALSSVQNLKDMIERLHGFPAANIVLLVSGGEMLTPGSLVCSYSAGTDTNPIYMFCTVDVKPQPWPSIEPDVDLKEQVDRCLSLPATYSTVVTRATLAQQIYDLAREEESICERLVHEQHLQQQGWSAVIANMEDLTDEFRQRYENFNRYFDEHLRKRNEYLELLGQFNKDLEKLSRIPILPGLMQNAEEEFHGFDDYLDNDEVFSRSQQNSSMIQQQQQQQLTNSQQQSQKLPSPRENTPESGISSTEPQKVRTLTLLQWISAKENHNTLRVMAEECLQGLVTFDDDKFDKLKQEVLNIIRFAEQEEIKEIKGLEDRLCGLEKLMFQLKKLVQDQKELSTAFQQNQNRASNLGDASILPDLCASHRSQLLVMLSSHKAIRDIRRRISRAKDELGANLEKRLKYIVTIENTMSELDNNLLFYHRCLKRVERHLNIIQQIHQTPSIYVSAVTEVIRRRIFSGEFVQWASNLACDFYTIHNEEVMRRQEFNASFEGHFLNTLFPGINDIPPAFANETPIIFDSNLPNLTKNDIEILSSYLPELTSTIQLPDMGSVIEFFVSRSGNKSADDKSSLTGKSQSNTAVGSTGAVPHRPIDIHAHLKDGFESETDTEEFEKVGQSANERNIPLLTATIATSTSENIRQTNSAGTSTDPLETHTVETLTEENLGSTRLEVERLKSLLNSMSQISYQCLDTLKKHLKSIKSDAESAKQELQADITKITESWSEIKNNCEAREKETLKRLSAEHQRIIDDIQKDLNSKQSEINVLIDEKSSLTNAHSQAISNLKEERDSLNEKIQKLSQEIECLQHDIKRSDAEKDKAVIECRDRLIHEHKTEIESLRCRFKLMTSMERSPSDTSLEKIEKPDVIDIACHELILSQTREDLNIKKELAIKAAVEEERAKWISQNHPTSSDIELLKNIIEEKTKQLDAMRERDLVLYKENCQLKIKIESLTTEEESDKVWLKEKIDFLNKDKNRLEQELTMEKSRRMEMETSFAAIKGPTIREQGSTPELSGGRCKMTSSQSLMKQGAIIESCVKGDIVFVVWNVKHGQYTVVQDSSSLYFVHGDSLPALNLRLPGNGETDIPVPFYCVGRIIDKEYCQARKDENRYKVTKGTRFYRVKLQPLYKSETSRAHHNKRERYESSSSSTSVSRSTSTQHLIDSFAQTENPVVHSSSRDMVDSASLKERTTSVTSVAEEDDEPISLLSERCRYISLSEEDEKANIDSSSSNTDCAITTNISTSTTSITTTNTTSSTNQQIPTESSSEKEQDDSDEYRSLEAKDETYFP